MRYLRDEIGKLDIDQEEGSAFFDNFEKNIRMKTIVSWNKPEKSSISQTKSGFVQQE